jgi:hypothetical protein
VSLPRGTDRKIRDFFCCLFRLVVHKGDLRFQEVTQLAMAFCDLWEEVH